MQNRNRVSSSTISAKKNWKTDTSAFKTMVPYRFYERVSQRSLPYMMKSLGFSWNQSWCFLPFCSCILSEATNPTFFLGAPILKNENASSHSDFRCSILSLDKFRPAVLHGTLFRSSVSWLSFLSVKAAWYGYWEAQHSCRVVQTDTLSASRDH